MLSDIQYRKDIEVSKMNSQQIKEDDIIRLISRYIARTLDNLSQISISDQNEIKRQFRFLQDDIIKMTKQDNKITGENNGKKER